MEANGLGSALYNKHAMEQAYKYEQGVKKKLKLSSLHFFNPVCCWGMFLNEKTWILSEKCC
jgi:hypothetical protein